MTDTLDHLANRQNSLPEDSRGEMNARVDAVVKSFGANWLAQDSANPVQALWSRKDAQSTNELLLLGDAIKNLSMQDSTWVARQVSAVKSDDGGTRAGALFELLGLNLFYAPGQRVVPASANNPGYDGSIVFGDGSSLMLSIKNHGVSSKELDFRAKAEQAANAFVAAYEPQRGKAFVRIAATEYPREPDWDRLRRDIPSIAAGNPPRDENFWSGRVQDLPAELHPLSPTHVSYLFQIAAPYHPNEQKNFFENIRKGIANLEMHQPTVAPEVCRTLLLRLSATASLPDCVAWANWYLRENPGTAVELILLYQAVPAVLDLARNVSGITHCVVPVSRPQFQTWQSVDPRRRFTILPLIGTVVAQPTRIVMTNGTGDRVPLAGMYLYQRGDIYRSYPAGSATLTANLSSPSPGVLIHADIEGLGALQMIAPPNPELLLLP